MKNYKKLLQSNRKLDVPVSGIIELQLYEWSSGKKFNEVPDQAWKVLILLYDKILKRDPLWHFLYEGGFTALRISQSSLSDVKTVLNKEGVKFKHCGKWGPDSQHATKIYQQVYTYLFHGFSILVVGSPDTDIGLIYDRIYHCSTNMLYHRHRSRGSIADANTLYSTFEAEFLANNAVRRAHYIGKLEATYEMNLQGEKMLSEIKTLREQLKHMKSSEGVKSK